MIGPAEIELLFEDFLLKIGDPSVRADIVATWVTACKAGGWEAVEELEKVPFTLLTDTHGVSFLEHTIAVTEGALALARAQLDTYGRMPYPIDLDRLVAGALLHDVGKLLEIERDGSGGYRKSHSGRCARHPISGAIMAAKAGLSEEIVNTIGCHAKEGDGRPQVIETILIHQADFATYDPLVMLKKGDLIQ